MAYEQVRFMAEENYPKFGTIGLVTGSCTLLLCWALWDFITAALLTLVALFVANIVWRIIMGKRVVATAKASWYKRSYRVDYEVGMLLIDVRAKKVGILEPANATYDIYDFSDIRGWEHQWVDKVAGGTATNHISRVDNKLLIKTNNPGKPLYKIALLNHKAGEMWMARLGALFNG